MGGIVSCGAEGDVEQKERSKEIDKKLNREKKKDNKEIKLLLLGTGASGKSTFAKQMKILHKDGFSEEERKIFTDIIHYNTFKAIKALIVAANELKLDLKEENEVPAREIRRKVLHLAGVELTKHTATVIRNIWEDPAIQNAYKKRAEFTLDDSSIYFFENLERISDPAFVPTQMDVLRARAPTTGILETTFTMDDYTFKMCDVGGQRNERKKWIHCFADVTAIIFVVALSEYNLLLEEDQLTNRMQESLRLFDDIINNRWFISTSIILFLNKRDLFEQKIKDVPLTVCFKDYTGPQTYEAGVEFIGTKFKAKDKNTDHSRSIYQHETCATDSDNVKKVFEAVHQICLAESLKLAGLIPPGVDPLEFFKEMNAE